MRSTIDVAVRAANASLGPSQRVVGWRLWPESDFPRTHTLKVKRDPVRTWVGANPI
jgi:long-chain acyl-CoA synthetase